MPLYMSAPSPSQVPADAEEVSSEMETLLGLYDSEPALARLAKTEDIPEFDLGPLALGPTNLPFDWQLEGLLPTATPAQDSRDDAMEYGDQEIIFEEMEEGYAMVEEGVMRFHEEDTGVCEMEWNMHSA